MGDIRKTCAISHAPIFEGQKVRLFFIASDRLRYNIKDPAKIASISKGGITSSSYDFKVIGTVGLEAVIANEYGRSKFNEKSIEAVNILNTIRESGLFYSEKEDTIKNVDKNITFKQVFALIDKGNMYIKSLSSDVLDTVALMEVHESVYQMMIDEKIEKYSREKGDYYFQTFKTRFDETMKSYAELKVKVDNYVENYIKRIIDKKSIDIANDENVEQLRALALCSAYSFYDLGQSYENDRVYMSEKTFAKMIQMLDSFPKETPESIIAKIVNARMFFENMDLKNIMIRPSMEAYETKDIEDIINFHNRVAKELKKINDSMDF